MHFTVSSVRRKTTSAGLLLLLVASAGCRLDAQTRAEGMFDRTLAVGGPVTLEIRTGSGGIEIRRGPADSIRVIGRIRAGSSWFRSDVEEQVRRIEAAPPIEQEGDTIRVGRVGDSPLFRNISISYEVTVPMATRVQSHTGSGSQTISDLDGPVDASTGSGRVNLRNIRSDVRASTGSGGIAAEAIGGSFVGRAGSGHVDVSQAGEGDVSVATGSGGIGVRGARRALHARAGSGSIEIEGRPAGNWDVETGSGGVRIDFPEDSAFELNARTGSGSINMTHPISLVDSRSRTRLRGMVRGGGSRVDLSTGSGSIQID
jgi:hypothetical protein